VGHASSQYPQKMQREKLIRKNEGYRRPFSSSAAWREMQSTGQAAAQRLQATHRSCPRASRERMIRPRQRGGICGRSSGYWTVTRFRKVVLRTVQMVFRRLSIIQFRNGGTGSEKRFSETRRKPVFLLLRQNTSYSIAPHCVSVSIFARELPHPLRPGSPATAAGTPSIRTTSTGHTAAGEGTPESIQRSR
jgi:hypothetical protein